MSILGNYVELKTGVTKKLKITEYYFDHIDMLDPESKIKKIIKRLNCKVSREDDQDVSKIFSVTSEKLAQSLFPFLQKDLHLEHDFEITMTGKGYMKEYTVSLL